MRYTVSSSSAGQRAIARSWNYTEFFPLNWGAVADYQAAHHALFGRYPSFARLMKNARIKDQILVFDWRFRHCGTTRYRSLLHGCPSRVARAA